MAERYVQLLVRKLEEAGELYVDAFQGKEVNGGATNRYYIVEYGQIHGENRGVVNHDSPGVVNPSSPNPLVKPLVEPKQYVAGSANPDVPSASRFPN